MTTYAKQVISFVRSIPLIGEVSASAWRTIRNMRFQNSDTYWKERYNTGGNSGAGSYGRLAEFKARTVNDIVAKNSYQSAIEIGCGDGAQLSLLHIGQYIGVDVSQTIIERCKKQFSDRPSFTFLTQQEFEKSEHIADISLSLDVIYHLVEDIVFDSYMHTLFNAASDCVIIYASNKDETTKDSHVRHRKFTDWVNVHKPNFCQESYIPNPYPFDADNPETTSFADFYVFKNQEKLSITP